MEKVKFTFDDDFSDESLAGTYSGKLRKVSDDSFAQGKEQGYVESLQSMEKNSELLLENIKNSVAIIVERHENQVLAMEKNATMLVLSIVKKLAPAMVQSRPMDEIEHLVQECLKNNPLEPRMVIRLDDKMLPLLRKKIETLQAASDYNGQIVLVSEDMGNISDCRVEWADGGAERDFEGVMKSIDEVVQTYIDAASTNNGAHTQHSEVNGEHQSYDFSENSELS